MTLVDSDNNKTNFVIPPPPPMPPPHLQNTVTVPTSTNNTPASSVSKNADSSDYCTIKELKSTSIGVKNETNMDKMSPNSFKNSQRKSVAFQDGPPSLIDETINVTNVVARKLSLGRFNSRSEFNVETKARRKSLTNYISNKAAIVSGATQSLFNSKSTNQLKTTGKLFKVWEHFLSVGHTQSIQSLLIYIYSSYI